MSSAFLFLFYQIGLFANLTIHKCPGIVRLVKDDETLEELLRLPPEAILLRWFNYQLEEAGHVRRVANFSGDISDSENYSVLLYQVMGIVSSCKQFFDMIQPIVPTCRQLKGPFFLSFPQGIQFFICKTRQVLLGS